MTTFRTHPPKVGIRPTSARKQRAYRARLRAKEIRPRVPVSARVVELLVLMATTYGKPKLTQEEAEARSADRGWIVAELVTFLAKKCDEFEIPREEVRRRRQK